jgi:hypothetical protein
MLSFLTILMAMAASAFRLQAQGYVDPGAGAMIWQIIAAGCVGAIFLFRKFMLRWFKKRSPAVDSTRDSGSNKS